LLTVDSSAAASSVVDAGFSAAFFYSKLHILPATHFVHANTQHIYLLT